MKIMKYMALVALVCCETAQAADPFVTFHNVSTKYDMWIDFMRTYPGTSGRAKLSAGGSYTEHAAEFYVSATEHDSHEVLTDYTGRRIYWKIPARLISAAGTKVIKLDVGNAGHLLFNVQSCGSGNCIGASFGTMVETSTKGSEPKTVTLINWSNNYTISVQNASGKWITLRPRTQQTSVQIWPQSVNLAACSKSATQCDDKMASFKVSATDTSPANNTILVLDAGNTFFSGFSAKNIAPSDVSRLSPVQKSSISKTIRILPLTPNDPSMVMIAQELSKNVPK